MVFGRLEDQLAFDWSADTPEMKKKIRQTPSAFFITRGKRCITLIRTYSGAALIVVLFFKKVKGFRAAHTFLFEFSNPQA